MTGLGIEYSPCTKCDKTKCSFCELAKYKNSQKGCQPENRNGIVEVETVSERIIRKQTETSDYWQNDVKQYRASKGYSNIEHDVDNFLRGYNEAVEDMLAILDERKAE